MMSSAIPARLQFQCGHAAMVTLPRVKGESSAQRNERIAREKSAALSRQCDFCGPTVAVAAPRLAEEINGSHMTAAEIIAAEPIAVEPSAPESEPAPVAPLVVMEAVVSEEPVENIVIVEEVVPEEVLEEVVEEALAEEIAQEILAEEILAEEEPEEDIVLVEEVAVEPRSRATRRSNGVVTHRRRASQPVPTRRAQMWVISYTAEQVVRAATIHEALRKASALGATEVLSIAREA